MKLYSVYRNTGNWGGCSLHYSFGNNEKEAMINSFSGKDSKQKEDSYKFWLESKYDITATEITNGKELLNRIPLFPTVPDGYEFVFEMKLVKKD